MLFTLLYNIVLLELQTEIYNIIKKRIYKRFNNALCLDYKIENINKYINQWIII